MLHVNSFDFDTSSSLIGMNDVWRKYWIWNTEFRVMSSHLARRVETKKKIDFFLLNLTCLSFFASKKLYLDISRRSKSKVG